MINRVDFIESVSGIEYPEMLVHFFDHFIALKNIVEDSGKIIVLSSTDTAIKFSIEFKNKQDQETVLNIVSSLHGFAVIYGRVINVEVSSICENSITISLS